MQQHTYKIGKTTILVHSDDFEDGYTNGLIAHPEQEHQPLTDAMLYEIIVKNMLHVGVTNEWNTGYIVGAIHGLLTGRPDRIAADAPKVQLGTVTLHLNNWRFREGYSTGQEDHQLGQDERESPTLLTASDLLRYIAHRDPDTKRYYFAEDELSTLEETLGQLVGYVCASLFPQPELAATQEAVQREPKQRTEPLQSVALQEA